MTSLGTWYAVRPTASPRRASPTRPRSCARSWRARSTRPAASATAGARPGSGRSRSPTTGAPVRAGADDDRGAVGGGLAAGVGGAAGVLTARGVNRGWLSPAVVGVVGPGGVAACGGRVSGVSRAVTGVTRRIATTSSWGVRRGDGIVHRRCSRARADSSGPIHRRRDGCGRVDGHRSRQLDQSALSAQSLVRGRRVPRPSPDERRRTIPTRRRTTRTTSSRSDG